MREPRFEIGQKIYSALYEGGDGIIIDITYSYRKNEHSYLISQGIGLPQDWMLAMEISNEKVVI